MNNTFFGGTGLPVIVCEVTINGDATQIIRGVGAPNFRIFGVNNPGILRLNGIEVRNGYAADTGGGGILNVFGGQVYLNNSVVALIDHQPFVAFPVRSITPEELTNNITGLAKVTKALEVPVVLTTINAEGGPLKDPLFTEITEVFPDITPIDRTNTNAWSDERFVQAIKDTGRKNIIAAGLWTEVCLAQTGFSAMKDGYEFYFVSDASGGVSVDAHNMAVQRLIQAGAHPTTWQAVMAELCPDNTTPEYQRLYEVVSHHGAGVGYAVQYVIAQLSGQNTSSAG